MKTKFKLEYITVVLFILVYAVAAMAVALNRYWQFNSFWYDFGIFDSTIWQLSRFNLPIIIQKAPPEGIIVWGDHFNPSVILLAPLYWLTNRQEIIIIAQVVFVCFGAFVSYLTSRKIVENGMAKIALIVSYLGFVGMQNALFTDVHNIVFAVLPLSLTIHAIFNKNWKLYFLFLIIAIGFQENLALIGSMLGLFLIISKQKVKIGAISFFLCLLYFFIVIYYIIPFFNHSNYAYQPQIIDNPFELIGRFFIPNVKLNTIIYSLLTFGILPIFSISTLPLIMEQYFERFVLNVAATRWDLGFHYNAILSPIFFLSCLNVIITLQKQKISKKILNYWGIATILIVFLMHRFILHGPLMMATMPAFYRATNDTKFLYNFTDQIPKEKLLMIQNNLGSHFSHEKMLLLSLEYDKIKPDIIALDLRDGQNANNFYPLTFGQVKELVNSLEKNSNYRKKIVWKDQIYFEKI